MTEGRIRLGTRGSPLALAQAQMIADALAQKSRGEWTAEIVTFTTQGDRLQEQRLTEAGGKGLFTRELDRALDEGEIDIAVHSLKDVPTKLPEGQVFLCVPAREETGEAFICDLTSHPRDLPEGARVGTASLRRQAQLLAMRPDLEIVTFRGNVQTRLRKLEEGLADATILALAGLKRLDLVHVAAGVIGPEDMLPAPCQGIVAVTARAGAHETAWGKALAGFSDAEAMQALVAERAFLTRLDGSCRTPIAGWLKIQNRTYHFFGEVLSEDGAQRFRADMPLSEPLTPQALAVLGKSVAEQLLEQAGGTLPAWSGQG